MAAAAQVLLRASAINLLYDTGQEKNLCDTRSAVAQGAADLSDPGTEVILGGAGRLVGEIGSI